MALVRNVPASFTVQLPDAVAPVTAKVGGVALATQPAKVAGTLDSYTITLTAAETDAETRYLLCTDAGAQEYGFTLVTGGGALTSEQAAHLMAIPTTPLGTGGVTTSTPITRSVVVERGTDKVLSFDADTVGRVSTLRLYLPGDEGLPALSKSGTPAGTLTNVSLTDTETAALSGSYRMVLDSVLGDNTRRDLTGTLVAV